jgi:hypothetical protein
MDQLVYQINTLFRYICLIMLYYVDRYLCELYTFRGRNISIIDYVLRVFDVAIKYSMFFFLLSNIILSFLCHTGFILCSTLFFFCVRLLHNNTHITFSSYYYYIVKYSNHLRMFFLFF